MAGCRAWGLLAVVWLLSTSALAAPPSPSAVTPELIAAAKADGKVVFYTSIELVAAEKLGKAFEAAYPGIAAQVERNGAERIFQRLDQERSSKIHAADVLESSDASHFLAWKRRGWLEPFLPKEVAEKWPAEARDPDGLFASERFTLSVIGYNAKLIKPGEAPTSFADLLDKRWVGKIVKAHPGYSGTIMTATFQMARELGWDYFERLGKQKVMQVQSAAEPPKKVALGERPVMADGAEYMLLQMKESGSPIDIVYPHEGAPLIAGNAGLAKDAPHPSAARLFLLYLFSREAQQLLSDSAGTRSYHPEVKFKAGRKPLAEIKLMHPDAQAQEQALESIKQNYAKYFGI